MRWRATSAGSSRRCRRTGALASPQQRAISHLGALRGRGVAATFRRRTADGGSGGRRSEARLARSADYRHDVPITYHLPPTTMEFRRIDGLPPYVFAAVNQRKLEARRAGDDVIDLGFGNPDIPSAPFVVDKLVEAAQQPTQPPVLHLAGSPQSASCGCRALSAPFRGGSRPRDPGDQHDRCQGGSRSPDVDAGPAG